MKLTDSRVILSSTEADTEAGVWATPLTAVSARPAVEVEVIPDAGPRAGVAALTLSLALLLLLYWCIDGNGGTIGVARLKRAMTAFTRSKAAVAAAAVVAVIGVAAVTEGGVGPTAALLVVAEKGRGEGAAEAGAPAEVEASPVTDV